MLLRVQLFIIFLYCKKLSLDLNHFLLIKIQQLHIPHLLLVRDSFLRFIKVRTESSQSVFGSHHALVNIYLNVDPWHYVRLLLMLIWGKRNAMLEQVFSGQTGCVVSLKKMALIHKIGDHLLPKDHHVVWFDFKRHSTLAKLAVNQQFATLVFESIFLLQKILSHWLDLTLEKGGELVKFWAHDEFHNLISIDGIWNFEQEGRGVLIPRILLENTHVLLQVADIGQDGIVDILQGVFLLVLHVDASLEQDLLFFVKVFKDIYHFV